MVGFETDFAFQYEDCHTRQPLANLLSATDIVPIHKHDAHSTQGSHEFGLAPQDKAGHPALLSSVPAPWNECQHEQIYGHRIYPIRHARTWKTKRQSHTVAPQYLTTSPRGGGQQQGGGNWDGSGGSTVTRADGCRGERPVAVEALQQAAGNPTRMKDHLLKQCASFPEAMQQALKGNNTKVAAAVAAKRAADGHGTRTGPAPSSSLFAMSFQVSSGRQCSAARAGSQLLSWPQCARAACTHTYGTTTSRLLSVLL